jgi:aspartyl-tRNA(Asn)/glutamyl-tRNA(Gln) amidotransferase subunit A
LNDGTTLRLPAAYNGLVGYKPSYGVVSRWGLVPYCASLDTVGFITRDVADAATLLDITQGIDPLDATSVDADPRTTRLLRSLGVGVGVGGGFAARSRSSATAASRDTRAYEGAGNDYVKSRPSFHMRGWRVGVPAEYDVCEVSDEVRRAWSATLRACEDLGAIVCAVSLPHTRAALAAYYTIAPRRRAATSRGTTASGSGSVVRGMDCRTMGGYCRTMG